ncbi:flagellar biosynthetic protein FliR [Roseateles sp. BYS78W]|uniref:Flagellar biosynthetic protein FliR n=1 Tax=Pelomonas candidula TaxID=3299025 RepID=A0ABW7HH05_9BURK
MDLAFTDILLWLSAFWWPFCRTLALFATAPMIGEAMVPMSVRALLALPVAVVMMPISQATAHAVEPLSLQAIAATAEQGLIGLGIGLTLHLAMGVITTLGFLLSSQLGLAMAVLNDPLNGSSSDVITALVNVLCMLVFFGMDGHLLFVSVLGRSFSAWPVGGGLPWLTLQGLAYNLGWVFSAAMLLALPVVAGALVVQVGMGFLNRASPALNLFSLGYTLITLIGLFMLSQVLSSIPSHYIRMTEQLLDGLSQAMKASHGG